MKCLAVHNWDETYENFRSREVKRLGFVCIPNRHDGEGYLRVMSHERADTLFASWVLILQVSSKCLVRGLLVRDGGVPHDAESIAFKTHARTEWLTLAIPFLVEIGWLEVLELPDEQVKAMLFTNASAPRRYRSTDQVPIASLTKEGRKERTIPSFRQELGGQKGRAFRRAVPSPAKAQSVRRQPGVHGAANPQPSAKPKPRPLPVTLAEAMANDPALKAKVADAVAAMRAAANHKT